MSICVRPLLALFLAVAPLALVATPVPAAAQAPASESARLTTFLDAEFEKGLALRPQQATQLGRKEGMDRLNDFSEAGQLKLLQLRRDSVARLKAQFDRAKLPPQAQASYDMWVQELARAELSWKWRRYSPLGSWSFPAYAAVPNFMINAHVVQQASDMRAYNARLRALGPAMDQMLESDRASVRDGIRAPRFLYERVTTGARSIISGQPFDESAKDSPLWADAKAKVGKLQTAGKVTPPEAQALLDEARAALLTQVKPVYERTIAWVQSDIGNAPVTSAALTLKDGKAWYAASLKLMNTTDLTAEQIHQTGLAEVKRIEAEQDALARKAGAADAEAYYAERDRLYPPTPWTDEARAAYLAEGNADLAATRAKLPGWFGKLPAHRVELIREPSFSEVAGGAAHAAGPSPDGSRPGRVFVHLLGTQADPAGLKSLMCHEGIPGHVMAGDIAIRQTGVPKFRTASGYVAYNEGWALYTEAVCKEMGVYTDIASDFMRLDAERFRAARLVVDTGIHDKGWSEEQAVQYMIKTGKLPEQQARSEVRRYITNSGQATGYKIGMIQIMRERAKAEKALGPKFDIKAFHDLVVGSGPVPLSVLSAQVDEWIRVRKAS